MKRIAIIGTRKRNTITDYNIVKNKFFEIYEEGDIIVSGHCKDGGDKFAEKISEDYGIPILLFPPKKGKTKTEYIKSLFARNTKVAKFSTDVLACLMNPEDSIEEILKRKKGGTEHTLKQFRKFYPDGRIIIV